MTVVGVLAIQGDYALHAERLAEIGASVVFVRKSTDLRNVDALVLPGGESTTFLKLIDDEFRSVLIKIVKDGLPTLGTCAGLILLASRVSAPKQASLCCLDVSVERNSYGRQVDSFVAPLLEWTKDGRQFFNVFNEKRIPSIRDTKPPAVEGVFIRAPRIISVGPNVKIFLTHKSEPVLVCEGNVLGATFHPEVTGGLTIVHEMLLHLI